MIVEKLEGEKQRIAEMIGRFQALMLSKHATEEADIFMHRVTEAQKTLATRLRDPDEIESICFMSGKL